MADLIDRDALKDYISSLWDMQDAYLPCHFFDAMDDMPVIDAEPVRHGHWIDVSDEYDDIVYRCSCCGEDFTLIDGTLEDNRLFYCPNCGAKMDEEAKNE